MIAVQTSEELRKAIENNEDEILIDDEDLARKMLQFKRMKIITKRGLIGVAVVAIFGILLSFFFWGGSGTAGSSSHLPCDGPGRD